MLADLYALYERLLSEDRVARLGFARAPVHALVDVALDGSVRSVTPLHDERGAGQPRLLPGSSRTSQDYAHLVSDKLEYVAGLPESPEKRHRAATRHRLYLELLDECAADLHGSEADALRAIGSAVADGRAFLEYLAHRAVPLDLGVADPGTTGSELRQSGWIVDFQVEGDPVFPEVGGEPGMEAVVAWWSDRQRRVMCEGDDGAPSQRGVCQVLGVTSPLTRLFPSTRLPTNQPKLVSANFAAAERYQAQQSTGASVSPEVAHGATSALNWLVEDAADAHSHRYKNLTTAWWAPDVPDANPLSSLWSSDPKDIGRMLDAVWSGWPGSGPSAPFHVALLRTGSARVVVLAHHVVTLGALRERLDAWFTVLRAVRDADANARLGLRELAESAFNPRAKHAPARERILHALLRTALFGDRLPAIVRDRALSRCRVGDPVRGAHRREHVSAARAALLHLYAHSRREQPMTGTAAELCGRVFALLEIYQSTALGKDLNRGVAASYPAASSTPQLAFPRLLNRRVAYASRIRREKEKRGYGVKLDRALEPLMCALRDQGGFPARLDPAGQADFALGYWHQCREYWSTRSDDPVEGTDTEENQ